MKRLNKILLFTFALALLVAAQPAAAAPRDGGHGRGGRGGHGGHGGGRGHFGGRTRVFIGVGGGWGWGYGGWPGYYGYGPGYYGYYGPGYYGRPYGAYGPSAQYAAIDTDISPEEAQVYLDGRYIGTADDFDGYPDNLYLKPGRYRIEFRLEGHETLTRQIEARRGMSLELKDKLRRIAGAKQYGSYERPRQQGEVRRFFGRKRDAVEAIEPSEQPADALVIAEESDEDSDTPPEQDRAPAPRLRRDRDSYGERWRDSERPRAEAKTRLRLNVEPSDAAVYVDNRFAGTAEEVNSLERGVSIAPGKHTVTVSRPGFRDKTTDITVEQGRTETLEISLSR